MAKGEFPARGRLIIGRRLAEFGSIQSHKNLTTWVRRHASPAPALEKRLKFA
jgi:hypothetical protein